MRWHVLMGGVHGMAIAMDGAQVHSSEGLRSNGKCVKLVPAAALLP
jgi:hypothetical protein